MQLHASSDRGATWHVANRVKATEERFVFRAPHDGEYWFCIRTVDKQGTVRPEGPQTADLKVLVDTMQPRLDLTAVRGTAGEVTAHWQAIDPNLKPDTLSIEYQAGANEPWERVAVETPTATDRYTLIGEVTFWPKATADNRAVITVRAQIADRAGNPAATQTQAKAAGTKDTAGASANNKPGDAPRTGDTASHRPASWPADHATSEPLRGDPRTDAARGATPSPADTSGAGQQPFRLSSASGAAGTNVDGNGANSSASGDANSPGSTSASGRGALRMDLLPPGERPRMINSRRFELDYDVEAVGPSGIAKVELWGSTDGGKAWKSFGVDGDNRSPLAVSVPGEGLYGFNIVFQNGNGFGGFAPREGDTPELWVGVDLTPPVAKILAADVGRDGGELIIRWEAQDDMLDPRPIALYFSDRPNGSWSAIAAGLENTGQYAWRLDNRVPGRIFLRLEARDEAGNIGQFVSPEPISLDLQRPQGRIRNVRPIGPVTQGANPAQPTTR